MSGTILFCGQGGCPAAVQPVASNAYTVPPRSSFQFQTTNAANTVTTGSIRVTPASGSKAPAGVAVFSLKTGGVTVSTAGVPGSGTSNAFRMYAELSGTAGQIGSLQTGIAIANPGTGTASVVFELNTLSGTSTGLTGSLSLPAGGQTACVSEPNSGLRDIDDSVSGRIAHFNVLFRRNFRHRTSRPL